MTATASSKALLLAVMLKMKLGCFRRMMGDMQMMGMCEVGIVRRFLMIAGFMVFCRFFVIMRGLLVMFGCFPMMVYWLF